MAASLLSSVWTRTAKGTVAALIVLTIGGPSSIYTASSAGTGTITQYPTTIRAGIDFTLKAQSTTRKVRFEMRRNNKSIWISIARAPNRVGSVEVQSRLSSLQDPGPATLVLLDVQTKAILDQKEIVIEPKNGGSSSSSTVSSVSSSMTSQSSSSQSSVAPGVTGQITMYPQQIKPKVNFTVQAQTNARRVSFELRRDGKDFWNTIGMIPKNGLVKKTDDLRSITALGTATLVLVDKVTRRVLDQREVVVVNGASTNNASSSTSDFYMPTLNDLNTVLAKESQTVISLDGLQFTASKYVLVPGVMPSGMGALERISLNERLARGISPTNAILRTGISYYDDDRGVDVDAGKGQFFIEYDNGAVELLLLPENLPAGQQHPFVSEVRHGGRTAPDLGQVPKPVLRTGLSFYDAQRGIDVHANAGHYLIEYTDQTIEQRPLPAGGFVPRPEDFSVGGDDNSKPRSSFGPSLADLGIADESSTPKPSSELILIGDRYISPSGQLRVAKKGNVFLQDPVTGTILLRPASDAAAAKPNTKLPVTSVKPHDESLIKNLFSKVYGRSPTTQELDYWRLRGDKSGDALLGAMQFAFKQEQAIQQSPSYNPQSKQHQVIAHPDEGKTATDASPQSFVFADGDKLALRRYTAEDFMTAPRAQFEKMVQWNYGLAPALEASEEASNVACNFGPLAGVPATAIVAKIASAEVTAMCVLNRFWFLTAVHGIPDPEAQKQVAIMVFTDIGVGGVANTLSFGSRLVSAMMQVGYNFSDLDDSFQSLVSQYLKGE